jgi:Right handed beta helix region
MIDGDGALLSAAPPPDRARAERRSVVEFQTETRVSQPDYFIHVVRMHWSGDEPARDVTLHVNIPGQITSVHPHGEGTTCTKSVPIRCSKPLLSRDEVSVGVAVFVGPTPRGTHVATASAATVTRETRFDNNFAVHTLDVTGLPDLMVSMFADDETVDARSQGSMRLTVHNRGGEARDVVIRARVEDGGGIAGVRQESGFDRDAPQASCTIASGAAICGIASFPHGKFVPLRLVYDTPTRRDGGKAAVVVTAESAERDFNPSDNMQRVEVPLRRLFVVTSADDEGRGTLRQVILEAAVECADEPCTIRFDSVSRIQPRSPLPYLSGTVRIDGSVPRVEIDGSQLVAGDGLHYEGCSFDVRSMIVRNFPGHGIDARPRARGCFSGGLFVRNSVLSHNERGIVTHGIDASIRANVIHDHRRAGIFIGGHYSEVYNNVVVNNGATGIFIHANGSSFHGLPPGADVIENIVHGNGEWGIARTNNEALVQMRRNSTIRNGLYGFDVGLDLDTPNRADDRTGVPNKPEMLPSAYLAESDVTIIRGRAPWGADVDLYVSTSLSRHGHAEAEQWLGNTTAGENGQFQATVPGDLRGQWITATVTRSVSLFFAREEGAPTANVVRPHAGSNTSELSDPFLVR